MEHVLDEIATPLDFLRFLSLAKMHAFAVTGPNTAAVDEVARLMWRAHAEGQLQDADAEAVNEALQARRASFAKRATPSTRPPAGLRRPARRDPRSPDRQASIERRRRQAMSGIVPAKIAASFTMAELAVLTVIGRQCQRAGVCVLPIDMIGALAGVERTTVQNALRQGRLLGLILVKERRIPGRPSLTNVVTVISREWLAWLKLGPGIGFKKLSTTANQVSIRGAKRKDCAGFGASNRHPTGRQTPFRPKGIARP